MKVILLLIASYGINICTGGTTQPEPTNPTVSYRCISNGTNGDEPGLIKFDGQFPKAPQLIYAAGKDATCKTGLTTTASTSYGISQTTGATNQWDQTFDFETFSIADFQSVCGFTTTGTVGSQVTKGTLFVQYDAAIITIDNTVVYTFECNWTSPAVEAVLQGEKVTVGSFPSSIPANVSDAAGILILIDPSEATQTSMEFKKKYKLRYKQDTSTNSAYTDARIYSCTCATDAAFTVSHTITDSDGCFVSPFPKPAKPWTTVAPGTDVHTDSTEFGGFAITGANVVYIRCEVKDCPDGSPACAKKDDCGSKRKRRDSQSTETDGETNSVVLKVTIVDDGSSKQGNSAPTQSGREHAQSGCISQVTGLTVVGVLTVLLLVSMIAAVYFGVMMLRSGNLASPGSHQKHAHKA